MQPLPFTAYLVGLLFNLHITAALAQSNLSTPEGYWMGSLQLPGASLRIVFHIKPAAAGTYTATLDSPDQGTRSILVTQVDWKNDSLQLAVSSR